MEKQEVVKLHEELYIYLMSVHKENPSFKFRVRRMNNQNRLIDGYWFNGNDAYIETSFWDYKDNLHQTPVMRLVYYFKLQSWRFDVVDGDDIGMKNRSGRLSLACKTLSGRRAIREMCRQNLDCDHAMQFGIVCFKNDPHSARANYTFHLIASEAT